MAGPKARRRSRCGAPRRSRPGNGMTSMRIEFAPLIDQDTRLVIINGVDHHNIAATGEAESFPVNLVLRGEDGDVLGGLLGEAWGKWLKITCLWVAEVARGK